MHAQYMARQLLAEGVGVYRRPEAEPSPSSYTEWQRAKTLVVEDFWHLWKDGTCVYRWKSWWKCRTRRLKLSFILHHLSSPPAVIPGIVPNISDWHARREGLERVSWWRAQSTRCVRDSVWHPKGEKWGVRADRSDSSYNTCTHDVCLYCRYLVRPNERLLDFTRAYFTDHLQR